MNLRAAKIAARTVARIGVKTAEKIVVRTVGKIARIVSTIAAVLATVIERTTKDTQGTHSMATSNIATHDRC
jgi:hypothetical protein